jgi:thioredoxin-dependent peroxiredoxin
MLKIGDPAPAFSLDSNTGPVKSSDLKGKRYVLYFYPKDDTPGCTVEACSFRDNLKRFNAADVPLFGVSILDAKSKAKFAQKFELNFPLLADEDHTLAEAYGVWVEKSMYGKTYMGIARTTYVIGANGRIEQIWEKVSPEGHADEVLAYLAGGKAGAAPAAAPAAKPAAKVKAAPKKAAK